MSCMICARCGQGMAAADARDYAGEVICEDCYVEVLSPIKTCDPWAVHSARNLKERQGAQLTPRQQRFFDLVKAKGEVSFPEAAQALSLKEGDLEREFAVLRHLELLRAAKRGEGKVIVLFD
jgi:hypothetical protein